MHDGWDFIGDVHGYADALESLLDRLGYQPSVGSTGWRHPAGRRAVFLGDYLDQGPHIARVLGIVRSMVASGYAVALMGNHEFNGLAWNTNGSDGQPLRPHTTSKQAQHQATLDQIGPVDGELARWVASLPLWIDHADGWRAIHAAWVPTAQAVVAEAMDRHGGVNESFLAEALQRDQPLFAATETVLKGLEIDLPDGVTLTDHYGERRSTSRVQWWQAVSSDTAVSAVVLPPGILQDEHPIGASAAAQVPGYPPSAPPVFCGHYRLRNTPAPLASNVACCDFSAGPRQRPLRAYRWDGEQVLQADKFI